MHKERSHTQEKPVSSTLASIGLRLSDWFERWFPDAFALALAAVAVVFAAALATGSSFVQTAQWFGAGFWDLVTFTMQMSMIVVTGYAVATSPPIYAVIRKLAAFPTQREERGCLCRPVLDAGLAGVLELQPDLQRPARARSRASRAWRGLSCDRRCRVSRRRKRLGARSVVVGCAHHGLARVAPGCDRTHQRRDPARARHSGCGRACSSRPR